MQLIDRDKLRSALENAIRSRDINRVYDRYFREGLIAAMLHLGNQPTFEERKHGHWTKDNKCSECGAERPTQGINKWIYLDAKYGYACGAKMDEAAKNENRTC